MPIYFSASTNGFYDSAIHGPRVFVQETKNEDGTITATEIDNPDCKIPQDAVEITDQHRIALLEAQATGLIIVADEDGYPTAQEPPPPTEDEVKRRYANAVQVHLDAAARAAGYDSIASAVTYAEEPSVPKFQNEGLAFRAWRSLCWAYCYEQLDAVIAGEREQPTVEEFISELPPLSLS